MLISRINTGEGAPPLYGHSCNLYKGNLFFYQKRKLCKYDLKIKEWTYPKLAGNIRPYICGHTSTLIDHRLLMIDDHGCCLLDLEKEDYRFEELPIKYGNRRHSANLFEGSLYLFGGFGIGDNTLRAINVNAKNF